MARQMDMIGIRGVWPKLGLDLVVKTQLKFCIHWCHFLSELCIVHKATFILQFYNYIIVINISILKFKDVCDKL